MSQFSQVEANDNSEMSERGSLRTVTDCRGPIIAGKSRLSPSLRPRAAIWWQKHNGKETKGWMKIIRTVIQELTY